MKHEHIQRTHQEVQKHFPKKCNSCSRVYATEQEYNQHTQERGDGLHYEPHEIVSFLRNCNCGSTLALNVHPDNFGMDHIKEKASLEGRSEQDLINEHRDRYNHWLATREYPSENPDKRDNA